LGLGRGGLGSFGDNTAHSWFFLRLAEHVDRRADRSGRLVAFGEIALFETGEFAQDAVGGRGGRSAAGQSEDFAQERVFSGEFDGADAASAHEEGARQSAYGVFHVVLCGGATGRQIFFDVASDVEISQSFFDENGSSV